MKVNKYSTLEGSFVKNRPEQKKLEDAIKADL